MSHESMSQIWENKVSVEIIKLSITFTYFVYFLHCWEQSFFDIWCVDVSARFEKKTGQECQRKFFFHAVDSLWIMNDTLKNFIVSTETF